jgi:CHAT domain-containing protein
VIPETAHPLGESHVVWLDGLTEDDLNRRLYDPGGWLTTYLELVRTRSKGAFEKWQEVIVDTGKYLWDRLLGPIDQRLRDLGLGPGAPVVMLVSGKLALLPLHAAWRLVNGHQRPFLEDWTVSYAPSGFALAVCGERARNRKGEPKTLLAVANPTADLRFTVEEMNAVAVFMDTVERLDGAKATREAVIRAMSSRTYLHFACHGKYEWSDPIRSHLVLARNTRLTLADVLADVDLKASRLVVLSACETGLIDLQRSPDDYLGLPAGFLQAGAPAVLSTLWRVDDRSTRLLIEQFYNGHIVQRLTPAAALREAQRWLMRQPNYDQPYYWAAFTLTGQ